MARSSLPILAKLALNHGLVSRAQIDEMLARRAYDPSMSLLRGMTQISGVSEDKVQELIRGYLKEVRSFSSMLLALGLITGEQHDDAIGRQEQQAARGILVRISSILDRKGILVTVGGYRLIECIGRGGMGAVFSGEDPETGKKVAIKIIRPDLDAKEIFIQRFLREAKSMAVIDHPNVVSYFGSGRDGAVIYLAVEFIDGQSLKEILRNKKRLSVKRTLPLVAALLEGLQACHDHGVIHRDLKPDNVLMAGDCPKIADFGLARREDSEESMDITNAGSLLGTPHYMSPEQCRGEKVDFRADLYSIGCLLFHALVGKPPYPDRKLTAILEGHLYKKIPDPRDKGIPEGLALVIEQLMAKEPENRPGSAKSVAQALRDLIPSEGRGSGEGQIAKAAPGDATLPEGLLEAVPPASKVATNTADGGAAQAKERGDPQLVAASSAPLKKRGKLFPILFVLGLVFGGAGVLVWHRMPYGAESLVPALKPGELRFFVQRIERQRVVDGRLGKDWMRVAQSLQVLSVIAPGTFRELSGPLEHTQRVLRAKVDAKVAAELQNIDRLLEGGDFRQAQRRVADLWCNYGVLNGVRRKLAPRLRRLEFTDWRQYFSLARESREALRSLREDYARLMAASRFKDAARRSWDHYARYGPFAEDPALALRYLARASERLKEVTRALAFRDTLSLPRIGREELPLEERFMAFAQVWTGSLETQRGQLVNGAVLISLLFLGLVLLRVLGSLIFGSYDFFRWGLWLRIALLTGNHKKAGKVLQNAGLHVEAGEEYLLANEPLLAAERFLVASDRRRAAAAFERGGHFDAATEQHVKRGDFLRAAELQLRSKEWDRAGKHFVKAGELGRAADAYLSGAQPEKAAEILERAGRYSAAAKILAEELGRSQKGGLPKKSQKIQERAKRVAELFVQAAMHQEAAEYFSKAGEHRSAVEQLIAAGDIRGAAQASIQAGERETAIKLLEKVGDRHAACLLRAELATGRGEHQAAGDAYERASEWLRASKAWEEAGQFDRAASCASRAKDDPRAADMLSANGEFDEAGELYEKTKQPFEALRCYRETRNWKAMARCHESVGDHLQAAQALLELGEIRRAISLLKKVRSDHGEYFDALALLGRSIADESGAKAIPELDQRLRGESIDEYSVVAFRALSELCARFGKTEQASQILRSLVEAGVASELDHETLKSLAADRQRSTAALSKRSATGSVSMRRRGSTVPELTAPSVQDSPNEETVAAQPPSPEDIAEVQRTLDDGQLVGRQIDRYCLEKKIGEGAFAWVYRARHVMLHRLSALKILKPVADKPELVRRRFLEEGRTISRLKHPNIVEVYDVGETDDGLLYMVLELLKGAPLRDYLQGSEFLAIESAVDIAVAILETLVVAHEVPVVHRDLKPENVFITDDSGIRVLDFGIAKVLHETTRNSSLNTKEGMFVGTPRYCSPEQARGENVGPASDLYAVGLILFELLTKNFPFYSKTSMGYLTQHAAKEPLAPREFREEIPEGLEAVILHSLRKEPGDRFPDAETFILALERFSSNPPG